MQAKTSSYWGSASGKKIASATTFDVLNAEFRRFWPKSQPLADEEDFRRRMLKKNEAALCLSGGGIRSAAFGLGVLQALSQKGLLTGFRYLSTVSGGGYIGSWLQRWIHERNGDVRAVMNELGSPIEPDEIKRLRANSNFITPQVGIGSTDTWTAVAISLRNILVNWLLFAPLLMLVVLPANLFRASIEAVPSATDGDPPLLKVILAITAIAAAAATFSTVRMLPSYRCETGVKPGRGDRWMTGWIIAPLAVWTIAATLALAVDLLRSAGTAPSALHGIKQLQGFGGIDVALWTLEGMALGVLIAGAHMESECRKTFRKDWVVGPAALLSGAAWVALGAYLFDRVRSGTSVDGWNVSLLAVLAPLWLLSAQLVVSIVFAAFRASQGPTVQPDSDREWLARLSALKIKLMLLWGATAFAALLANTVFHGLLKQSGIDLSLPGLIALVSGGTAVAGGRSKNSGDTVHSASATILRFIPLRAIVLAATLLCIVSLFVLLAGWENEAARALAGPCLSLREWAQSHSRWWLGWIAPEVVAHFAVAAVLLGLLWFFGRTIPVNRFSLNGLYRNRLARAFLGSARAVRSPDPFTGFDQQDNVRIHELDPRCDGTPSLYPVINMALNVTSTDNPAWQERMAEPFIASPLHCGSGMLQPEELFGQKKRHGAYAPSDVYGGAERDLGSGSATGMSLASAVSISGAAASPNMGYHSSPLTAFLMTLFNVRLGAWMPNPARAATRRADMASSGPPNSVVAVARELVGSTDDLGSTVYLSDGAHFENLAIYEMVRRRCRYIVVSDAGADPQCAFEDLGNAVRKVKIDFDVTITFDKMSISSRTKPLEPQLAWSLGTIHYPEDPEQPGLILYIKPSYFGRDLPIDVVAYAAGSGTFPHETTGDQFYSESQFESYRRLGHHFAALLGLPPAPAADVAGLTPIGAFLKAVETQQATALSPGDELERSGFIKWLKKKLGL